MDLRKVPPPRKNCKWYALLSDRRRSLSLPTTHQACPADQNILVTNRRLSSLGGLDISLLGSLPPYRGTLGWVADRGFVGSFLDRGQYPAAIWRSLVTSLGMPAARVWYFTWDDAPQQGCAPADCFLVASSRLSSSEHRPIWLLGSGMLLCDAGFLFRRRGFPCAVPRSFVYTPYRRWMESLARHPQWLLRQRAPCTTLACMVISASSGRLEPDGVFPHSA